MPAVKRTELEVFSGGGKIAKNRAKQPGIIPFAAYSTGLKTDPGAFRFCQIERIFNGLRSHRDSAIQSTQKNGAGLPPPADPAATPTRATGKTC